MPQRHFLPTSAKMLLQLVNLLVAFGETGDQALWDAEDFKAADIVMDVVAERSKAFAKFVAVVFLREPHGTVHALRLQSLPAALPIVECRIENDAMRVQMWIKRA